MRSLRRAAALCFAAAAGLTCTDAPTGPAHLHRASLALAPQLDPSAASSFASLRSTGVNVDGLRVALVRTTGETALDTTVAVTADQTTLTLALQVPLVSSEEQLTARVQLWSGTTVLFEGSQPVTVRAGAQSTSAPVELRYTGPGATAKKLVISPRDTTILVATPLALHAAVLDAQGQAVPDARIIWSSLDATLAAVNGDGLVTPVGTAGVVRIRGHVLASDTAVVDTVTVRLIMQPIAASIAAADGRTAFTGEAGATLADSLPPAVIVKDNTGAPLPGAKVQIALHTASGDSLITTLTTDAAGQAKLVGFVLPTTAGTATLTASVSGVATPVLFTVTITPGPLAALEMVSGNRQVVAAATIGTPFPAPLVVRARDVYGNVVAGVPVSWQVSDFNDSTPSTVSVAEDTTDAQGLAQVSLTMRQAGTATVFAWAGAPIAANLLRSALPKPVAMLPDASPRQRAVQLMRRAPRAMRDARPHAPRLARVGHARGASPRAMATRALTELLARRAPAPRLATAAPARSAAARATIARSSSGYGPTYGYFTEITIPAGVDRTWIGADLGTYGDSATSTIGWATPSAWYPSGVPASGERVFIPYDDYIGLPQITDAAGTVQVGSLTSDYGTIMLASGRLEITGAGVATTSAGYYGNIEGQGTVAFTGSGSQSVAGSFPDLEIGASSQAVLTSYAAASGSIRVLGTIELKGSSLSAYKDFTLASGARLVMDSTNGGGSSLYVDGNTVLVGDANASSDITTGWLALNGGLDVQGPAMRRAFANAASGLSIQLGGQSPQVVQSSDAAATDTLWLPSLTLYPTDSAGGVATIDIRPRLIVRGSLGVYANTRLAYPTNAPLTVAGYVWSDATSDLSAVDTLVLAGANSYEVPDVQGAAPGVLRVDNALTLAGVNFHWPTTVHVTGTLSLNSTSGYTDSIAGDLAVAGTQAHLIVPSGYAPTLMVGGNALFDGADASSDLAGGTLVLTHGSVTIGSTYSTNAFVGTKTLLRFAGDATAGAQKFSDATATQRQLGKLDIAKGSSVVFDGMAAVADTITQRGTLSIATGRRFLVNGTMLLYDGSSTNGPGSIGLGQLGVCKLPAAQSTTPPFVDPNLSLACSADTSGVAWP